jgi:hypothetical protein
LVADAQLAHGQLLHHKRQIIIIIIILLLLLLLFISTANGGLPGGSGTTIKQKTHVTKTWDNGYLQYSYREKVFYMLFCMVVMRNLSLKT